MKSHEIFYLQELMRDFPVTDGINDVEQALTELSSRFLGIEQRTFELTPSVGVTSSALYFEKLARQFHAILYDGILSNAGQYRQPKDPTGGVVLFGPQQKYAGTSASDINRILQDVFASLQEKSNDPIGDAVTFYQQFMQVHPFYDANGRIGRLIVTIYLDYYGFYIDWSGLQRNVKWLKLLNECHERHGQGIYHEYLNRLIAHWKKHIILKSDLERLE